MLMRSKVLWSYFYANYDIEVQVGFRFSGLFWKVGTWKSNYINQTWDKHARRVPSYVIEVKGHIELFLCELLWYWSSSWVFIFCGHDPKNISPTTSKRGVKDTIGLGSYVSEVTEVKGHVELFYVSYYDIGVQVGWSPILQVPVNLIWKCYM